MSLSGVADLQAMVYEAISRIRIPVGISAIVMPGTWNPADGTIAAMPLRDMSRPQIVGDTGTPLPFENVEVLTPGIGIQRGPKGGERCVLLPGDAGYRALIEHGFDDSVKAPAGETWVVHPDSGTFLKLTNDGPTGGDALGGLHAMGKALVNLSTSGAGGEDGGHSLVMNDTAKTMIQQSASGHKTTYDDNAGSKKLQHESAGGHKHIFDDVNNFLKHVNSAGDYHILDAAGREIASVAPKIAHGDRWANLASSDAALAQTHLTTFESSLLTQRLTDMIFGATNMVTAGIPNAATYKTQLLALAASALGHIGIPGGSSIVRIKS